MISLPRSSVEDSKEHKSCNVTHWRAVSFSCLSNSRKTLKKTGAGSAERLARTATRQPPTNGTRNSVQTTRMRHPIPHTSRHPNHDRRSLLPNTTTTTNRLHRRPSSPQDNPNDQRRRNTNAAREERIQNPRTRIRQLFRQEQRPTIPRNTRQLGIGYSVLIDGRLWAERVGRRECFS